MALLRGFLLTFRQSSQAHPHWQGDGDLHPMPAPSFALLIPTPSPQVTGPYSGTTPLPQWGPSQLSPGRWRHRAIPLHRPGLPVGSVVDSTGQPLLLWYYKASLFLTQSSCPSCRTPL